MIITQIKKTRIRPYGFKIKVFYNWQAKSDNNNLLKVLEWIILNIGPVDSNHWESRFLGSGGVNVYFDEESDALAFKLRWL